MEIAKVLEKIGLTEKQAKVYLACLQLGPAVVMSIASRAELKRPTTYLILDELMVKGLISVVPREKKKLFIAEDPAKLKEKIEEQLYQINNLLPELKAFYNSKAAPPAVLLYQGREGIQQIYKEIVSSGETEVLSFFSVEDISREFYESFQLFIDMLKNNPNIVSREIAYAKDLDHYYLKDARELPNHQLRLVVEKNRFFTDNIIYKNKVAIFSFAKRFVVVIESQDIAGSFRSLFELAWQSAQELPKT